MAGAVRFTAANQHYTRAASGLGSSFTWCAWIKIGVDRNSYSFFLTQEAGGNGFWTGFKNDGTTFYFDCVSGGGGDSATSFTVGSWYFVAVVNNAVGGGADPIYWKLAGAGSLSTVAPQTGNIVGPSDANTLHVGADASGNFFNGSMAAVKMWSAVLTQAELDAESATYDAVRTTNLWAVYKFDAGPSLVDASPNARSLTAGAGTPALDAAGPPITSGGGGTSYALTASGNGTTGGSLHAGGPTTLAAVGVDTSVGSAAVAVRSALSATGTGATAGTLAVTVTIGAQSLALAATGNGTTGGSLRAGGANTLAAAGLSVFIGALTIAAAAHLTATGTGTTSGRLAMGGGAATSTTGATSTGRITVAASTGSITSVTSVGTIRTVEVT
jgi:hypothetical protein